MLIKSLNYPNVCGHHLESGVKLDKTNQVMETANVADTKQPRGVPTTSFNLSCSARHIFLWMFSKAWVSNLGDFLKTFFNKIGYEHN